MYCFVLFKFWVYDFSRLLFFFVNIGPNGSKTFRTLLLPQVTFESFGNFSWIFFSDFLQPSISKMPGHRTKRTKLWAFEGSYSLYTVYVWQLSVQGQSGIIQCTTQTNFQPRCSISKMASLRAKWTEIWAYTGTLDRLMFRVLGHRVHFRFSTGSFLEKRLVVVRKWLKLIHFGFTWMLGKTCLDPTCIWRQVANQDMQAPERLAFNECAESLGEVAISFCAKINTNLWKVQCKKKSENAVWWVRCDGREAFSNIR